MVRAALGRGGHLRGRPRINVSSCFFVVTLHGAVSEDDQGEIESAVRRVPGVADVINRLRIE
jgi:osmotically-inducible protein OsmY